MILLVIDQSLQQHSGVQNDKKALCYQLKWNYNAKVKLNISELPDAISAGALRDCKNV